MSNNVSARNAYAEFHRASMIISKNVIPRSIQNWDKIENRETWHIFEKIADIANSSCDQISLRQYFMALAKVFNGNIPLSIIGNLKSMKIYREYVDLVDSTTDLDIVETCVDTSIKFVMTYCKSKNITNFDEYLYDSNIVPIIGKHFSSGAISKYFLSMIPNIRFIVSEYPNDIRNEYFKTFNAELPGIHMICNKSKKLRKIRDNFDKMMIALFDK